MPRTYEIHYTDGTDAAVVENCSQDAAGVRFSDDEGNQVFVPWHRVDEIRSYRTPDEPTPAADVEGTVNADETPDEPEVEPETEPSKAKATKKAAPDPAASKASEWAEADPAVVRAWAKEQKLDVADSGTIPKDVLAAYSAAHSG